MGGGLICYATRCTEGLTVEEFWSGLGLGILTTVGIVLFIRLLQGPDREK